MARWKARTDLTFLARYVLGYKDVIGPERFPFMNHLQKFHLPSTLDMEKYDRLDRGNWIYTPPVPMLELTGPRRVLIIDPRGFLKTTINAQSHSIQWILNYPDIAMMLVQSNSEKAEIILSEIKHPFQANAKFRNLFPEHCPTKRVNEFGTRAHFTTEARSKAESRKEFTMMTGSIDKGSAGIHVDVMKFSDIVEPNNVKTPDQIYDVIRSFNMMKNLLVSPEYWIDVEGTTYDFSDLYSKIIKDEKEKPKDDREWSIHIRGCYKKDATSLGSKPEVFNPEEMDTLPYLFAANGEKISNWPERWTFKKLEDIRKADEYAFATQQLNNPQEAGGETLAFPVNKEFPKWISLANFKKNVRIVHYTTTVDTAETQTARADYTTISTVGWDQSGRPYVVEVLHGKWLPDQIIDNIIMTHLKHVPLSISIEETAYVRGFKDGLQRKLQTMGLFINLKFIKRETTISKKERILNTLQPWYKQGELRFVIGLGHANNLGEVSPEGTRITNHLEEELKKFPRFIHDDILDSLSDHFQGREWLGRLAPRNTDPWNSFNSEEEQKKLYAKIMNQALGIEEFDFNRGGGNIPVPIDDFYSRTGGL